MQLVGIGLYKFSEAARLTGVPTGKLRRWLCGYGRDGEGVMGAHPPLWARELACEGLDGISFHDLLEVCFVREFRQLGISLQAIRIAASNAREILESSYPFTCRKFRSDGRSIFAEAMRESGEYDMLDLERRQFVMRKIVEPSLRAEIEFGTNQQAVRWYPMPRSRAVVLDPEVAFGKPIVTDTGLRTDILFDAWFAEGKDKRRVARIYEVSEKVIESAIRFEQRMAA